MFGRSDWVAAGVTGAVALTLYAATLAPTVTLEQSGALAVAGEHLGIGRVPGFPLWHLLARLFTLAFGFVHYRGYPNPAWATNLLSAVCGALSCGLVALCVACVGRTVSSDRAGAIASSLAAVAAGLLLATSHTLWSQAVITETHTLTLLCLVLFMLADLAWLLDPCPRRACALAGAFAVGLAQSHFTVLLLPALLLSLLLGSPRVCREFCIVGVSASALCVMLPHLGVRGHPWFALAAVQSIALAAAIAWRLSPSGRTVAAMLGLMAVGLALYAYLPLASEGRAPMQFGYARTWVGFWHVFTRGQYERIQPANMLSIGFLYQVQWYACLLRRQFPLPFLLAACAGVAWIVRLRGAWRKWLCVCLLNLFVFSIVLLAGANPVCDLQDTLIQRTRFIPSFALVGMLAGIGLALTANWIALRIARRAQTAAEGKLRDDARS